MAETSDESHSHFQYTTDTPQNFWNKITLSDETKIELFGPNHKYYISRGVNRAYCRRIADVN